MRQVLLTLLCVMMVLVASAPHASAQPPQGRTFEGEPVGRPPAGVTVSGSVLVEDVTVGAATTRAMHVADRSTTQHTRAIVRSAGQAAKHVEFDLLVRDATEPTMVAVHGAGAPAATGAWRFLFERESAGSTTAVISGYDGSWHRLARVPNLLDPNAWRRVAIDVSPDAVVLTAGGLRYKALVRAARPTTITDVEFASAGTAPAASSVYVDNLVITTMTTNDGRLAGVVPAVSPGRIVRAQPQRDVPVATFPATGGPFRAEVNAGSGWVAARVTGPDASGQLTVRASFTIDTPGQHPLSVRITGADGAATVATVWVPVDQFGLVATDPAGTAIRFPDVIRLADGRLLAAYHSAAAHAAANGTIKLVSSADLGRTWSWPTIVWGGPYDNRDPKLAQLSDGTILLTFFQTEWVGGTPRNRGVFVMRWPPGAAGFATPVLVNTSHTPAHTHGAAVELPGGDVLLPLYGNGARVARSTDGGRTFDPAMEIFVARDTATRTFLEPNISRLPSGALVMVIRTEETSTDRPVNATLSRSADNGRTWTPLEETDYPVSSHHQLLLTSDGRVLLTYGQLTAQGARPTRGVLIANPAGPWRGYPSVELYNAGTGFDQANPSSAQVEPGRYLTLGFNVVNRTLISRYSTDATYRALSSNTREER